MSYQRVGKKFVEGRKLIQTQTWVDVPTYSIEAAKGYLRDDLGYVQHCDDIIVAVSNKTGFVGTYKSRAAAARALDTPATV